ncbi:HAD-IA family hydrolase [Vibrio maerlii]|uniref:HAD-IA family hydrolase n=1 Tax=Vibrio maerlii TaxID=2231648 RepID=UPI000E3EA82A|nr:HAD-IA family hydrolase [Vibrio maerlii]
MSKIKCVIFDCDGTLVDSERLCCQALANVFTEFGRELPAEEYMKYFQGGKLADILSHTLDQLELDISLDELEPKYRAETKRLFELHLQPTQGIETVLDYLDTQGIAYCVASNAPTEKIRLSLQLTDLVERFEGKIYSAFDANSWKPEPDLIHLAMMNMGFSVNECLYIDDTPKGALAGVNAGVETLLYKTQNLGSEVDDLDIPVIDEISQIKTRIEAVA